MNDELLRLFSIGKAMKAKSALMVFCRWKEPALKAKRGVVPSKRPLKVWYKEDMTDSESRYGNCLCLHMWSIYGCFCSGSQACPGRSPVLSISPPPTPRGQASVCTSHSDISSFVFARRSRRLACRKSAF